MYTRSSGTGAGVDRVLIGSVHGKDHRKIAPAGFPVVALNAAAAAAAFLAALRTSFALAVCNEISGQ